MMKGSKPTKEAPEGSVVQPILQEGQVEGSMADVEEESVQAPVETNQALSDTQTGHPEGSTAIPDNTSRAAFEVLQQAAYAEVPKTKWKRTKRKVDEIEPALNDMINAASCQEICCFRLPAIVYFAQRKSDRVLKLFGICCSLTRLRKLTDLDHLDCDTSNPAGCRCCIIHPPVVCCELCNPQHFTNFARSDPAFRPKQPKNCAHIADYKADKYNMSLHDALNEFCEQETIKKFGLSRLKNSGPGLIMPNEVLERIVDCTHKQKITTKEHLQLKTRWSHVDTFSDAVLVITDMYRRPSIAGTSVPGAAGGNLSTATTNPKKAPKIGKSRCGACGELGHNSMYYDQTCNSIC
jgi:hypothetical protein